MKKVIFPVYNIAKEGGILSHGSWLQRVKKNSQTSRSKYIKGDEAMHEMRKTGGYMTGLKISALLPIILMVLWMFFSYLFYFMNCGIAQGIMEEAVQKAADVKITGAEYDTGKLSYQKVNQKLITGNVISSNKSGNTKAEKEMKEQLRRHLFMAEVSSVRVSTTPLRVSAKIKTRSAVVAGDFLSMFGICLFEYEGNDQAQGDFEIDQIRRWNALEGAMD